MSEKDTCDVFYFDEEKVNKVQSNLKHVDVSGVAQIFKAMADENRAKMIYALCQEDELCVCDLANIVGVTTANASHHLRTLSKQGLVKSRKEGKLAFYQLDDAHVRQLMMIGLTHSEEVNTHV